jgi:hypothetical protein
MSKRLRRKLAKAQQAAGTPRTSAPSGGSAPPATSAASRIQDIPSYRKLLEETQGISALSAALPVLRPELRRAGFNVDAIEAALVGAGDLARQVEEFTAVADRFNDLFAGRGWIMYADMGLEVAREAIALGEAGDLDGAERRLVAYYTPEAVRWKLRRMGGVRAFRPRERLADKALEDYAAGRYHACVPVVLALLDGMVSELHAERRGFFAGDVDLTAWDSVAGHERGLNTLVALMQKGRRKTTTEPIPVPYRHGILHGMDLGYDTPLVAAKTWAALFATREWAKKAESGELDAPPPDTPPSWDELLARHREHEEYWRQLEAWRPRDVLVGRDVPSTGAPEEYPGGTPERALVEFLIHWTRRNYGEMAPRSMLAATPPGKRPLRLRQEYERTPLRRFALKRVRDDSPGVTVIDVALDCEQGGEEVTWRHSARMAYVDERDDLLLPGQPGGRWCLMNWATLPRKPQDTGPPV